MGLKIDVLSEPKGSNPGGLCTISDSWGNRVLDGYFKYCFSSRLPPGHPFRAENQPVYETVSNICANIFGLHTPQVFVVDNKQNDVTFVNAERGFRDHNGRPLYFVSQLEPNPSSESIDKKLEKMVMEDSIYLDALQLGDYNRRQNYSYKGEKVCYLDLGCWRFACANDGFLKDRSGNVKPLERRELKRVLKRLNKYNVITSNQDVFNLADFVDAVPGFTVNLLNPRRDLQVKDLLSQEEYELIQNYLAQGFFLTRHKFEEKGLVD